MEMNEQKKTGRDSQRFMRKKKPELWLENKGKL